MSLTVHSTARAICLGMERTQWNLWVTVALSRYAPYVSGSNPQQFAVLPARLFHRSPRIPQANRNTHAAASGSSQPTPADPHPYYPPAPTRCASSANLLSTVLADPFDHKSPAPDTSLPADSAPDHNPKRIGTTATSASAVATPVP